jgi:AcrR family transcriptional regulator
MQLSRKHIVTAAMKLIEADGVEAVSMRRLATELGCGVIALYNHVSSRRALLAAVADTVMSGIAGTPLAGGTWADQLRAEARAFRQAAMTHPRCAIVALSMAAPWTEEPSRRPVSVSMTRAGQSTLAALREAGLSGPDEIRAGRAFAAYLAGSLLQASESDRDFEFGLDLLIRAIATAWPSPPEPLAS